MSGFDQFVAELFVILDDAVVDHGQFAGAVCVRMGVFIVGNAVSGPARVTDADGGSWWLFVEQRLQIGELADCFHDVEAPVLDDCQSGRVIAAIFQAPQLRKQYGSSLERAQVTNDSAHGCYTSMISVSFSEVILSTSLMYLSVIF